MWWIADSGNAGSSFGAVLAFAGAIVAAIATVASGQRDLSLRRRLQQHAEIVKTLPPEIADPLLNLMKLEVEEVVRRDARRILPRGRIFLGLGLTLGVFATATLALTGIAGLSESPVARFWLLIGSVVAILFAALNLWLQRRWSRDEHYKLRASPTDDSQH
jgi:threonine/homoserine/homoserine lactone efflux protein